MCSVRGSGPGRVGEAEVNDRRDPGACGVIGHDVREIVIFIFSP